MSPRAAHPRRLPYAFVKHRGIIVLADGDAGAPVALVKADAPATALLEVARLVGPRLRFREADADEFNDWLRRCYEDVMEASLGAVADAGAAADAVTPAASADLLDPTDDAPIIRYLNALLTQAIREGASDIHIETFEQRIVLRVRIDGVLLERAAPPRAMAPFLVSRVKVMARLDIAERRLPQDGRFSVAIVGKNVDIRVSTMPTRHGERVVLRLLDQDMQRLDLAALGLPAAQDAALRHALARPSGIVLVTGPTGSGKSTTLYACLQHLNDGSRNILTVEDPIEYDIEGIGQTQVNPKAGLSFARGLRAILRQDPDVVMIGEIRDRETAEIAVQASLTGHLVLSTLHTNSAIGAVTRLIDMGIEPFLLGAGLSMLIAQRLVRVLCANCREAHLPTAEQRQRLGAPAGAGPWYRATGCARCHGSGYLGRMALFEMIAVDAPLREQIHARASEQALARLAGDAAPALLASALRAVTAGRTSFEEALRVTHGD
ncbi:MAG: Type II secretion system protein E [Pseudomonadales bacterium]|nr:Type II secretion system protein E [Pseudomonadales bacterium]